ncbi:hypothetical protein BDF19DRAFT_453209 [Syncephalis fuscata]|nr:hypothetical protein BDF19DRAFT_453209 [Syncephalis fuscata]
MPPKKAGKGEKTVKKEKAKLIDDKTFGLKNKNKSAKVNRYVQQVKQQVEVSGNRKDMQEKEQKKRDQEKKKEAEAARKAELAELFKVAQVQQKVPFGTDPKTVFCVNFKNGHCAKGDKCRFSHDPNVGRKRDKIDLYTDQRANQEEDTMDTWDQSKLESVVLSKHGNPRVTTEIVCKYFLEAIDNGKYGWFWECPNGTKCIYRHALPPGFVLKSKQQLKEEAEKGKISFEEFLETERHKLGSNLTPVTWESFSAWKSSRKELKEAEEKASRQKKEAAFRAGKSLQISGRELFDFNPDLINDGEWADDDADAFDLAALADGTDAITTGVGSLNVDEDLFAEEDLGDLDDD